MARIFKDKLVRARKSLLTLFEEKCAPGGLSLSMPWTIHFVWWWDARQAFFAVAFALIQCIAAFCMVVGCGAHGLHIPPPYKKILRGTAGAEESRIVKRKPE